MQASRLVWADKGCARTYGSDKKKSIPTDLDEYSSFIDFSEAVRAVVDFIEISYIYK